MPTKIEDYALIGDCETAALVSRDGSIDWLCWPRFDSGAVFAALLGSAENGRWRLSPETPAVGVTRRYLDNTLILETVFTTADGSRAAVIDFMPLRAGGQSHVVRIVEGRGGQVTMCCDVAFRFDYGSIIPWVTQHAGVIEAIAGPDKVTLRSEVPLTGKGYEHSGTFCVCPGMRSCFVLSYASSFAAEHKGVDPERALEETERAWRKWAGRYKPQGDYGEHATRSLITLKALTYAPTGGIVAAPTTSLPELLGGKRNWDYRYCWLRDATFTLLALINSGYEQEAVAWRTWLRHAIAGNPARVQIMYGLAGERRLDEWEIPWLAGFGGSRPVRIGNAAAGQVQLDIFGEVMDALYQAQCAGLDGAVDDWDLQSMLIEHLETIWRKRDEGLWEVRGGPRHFTHSKVMAWVALDRAIKSIERFGRAGPLERWRTVRDSMHRDICRKGYNEEVGAFVQSFGSTALDASALLIPLVGFLPPTDPRVRQTVDRIGRELCVDGLIHRYDTCRGSDGLSSGEGAFLACSFWYADNLVLIGRRADACEMFERLLALRNDVGLLSEEYDPHAKRMLGNFPQAFSHIGLINTAHNLSKVHKPVEQRAGRRSEPDAPKPQPLVEKPG